MSCADYYWPLWPLTDLLERFRRGPELLAMVLTGVFGEEEDFVAAPGKWSIRQIIAHLADSEMVGAHRMRAVIAEDNPTLTGFDQNAVGAESRLRAAQAEAVAGEFPAAARGELRSAEKPARKRLCPHGKSHRAWAR